MNLSIENIMPQQRLGGLLHGVKDQDERRSSFAEGEKFLD